MIYADTSCLLKVLRPEPLSEAVWNAVDKEETVIISVLGELETFVEALVCGRQSVVRGPHEQTLSRAGRGKN